MVSAGPPAAAISNTRTVDVHPSLTKQAVKAVPGLRLNVFAKNGYVFARREIDTHKTNSENIKHKIARTSMCCVMPVLSKSLQIGRPSVTNQQVNQLTSQPGNQLTSKTVIL